MSKSTLKILPALMVVLLSISSASASLLLPGSSGVPDVFAPIPGGTLLASLDTGSVTSSNGKVTFDMVTAVYSDPLNVFGAGKLDFVYQVQNSANSIDGISRLTAIDFTGFFTDVGLTVTGSAIPAGVFVDGTAQPQSVDRSLGGDTIGFNFSIPFSILPGQTSNALIIETNATMFSAGSFNIIDGGVSTVGAFEPSGAVTVPESGSSAILLCLGMIGLFATYKVAFLRRKIPA